MDLIQSLKKLLEMERAYDLEATQAMFAALDPQALQRKGQCLLNLRITGIRSGLGGKSLIDLEAGSSGMISLPSHRFRHGDIVSIQDHEAKTKTAKKKNTPNDAMVPIEAVVFRITDTVMTIAMNENQELPDGFGSGKYRVNRLMDTVSYDRMEKTLIYLEAETEKPSVSNLVSVLLNQRKPQPLKRPSSSELKSFPFTSQTLNLPQQEAVFSAVQAPELALIHGPPGTGKTTVLVEIIHQLLNANKRVLVCAPSNIAVDNIIERLHTKEPVLRMGHPCRILPQVVNASLDVQTKICDGGQLVTDIRKEMDQQLAKLNGRKLARTERKKAYEELKALRKECRQRERKVVDGLIHGARVVFCTLCGSGGNKLSKERFDVVLVDEVSQSLEIECWIAALKGEKLILVGDPCQLPPTVKCDKAAQKGLETTMFDRIQIQHGSGVLCILTIQYRMHELIMEWSNKTLYGGKLVAHDSIKSRKLFELPHVKETDETRETLLIIDTTGCDMPESMDDDGESKYNEGESVIAANYVQGLINAGVLPSEIAIITPYNAQVQLLNLLLKEKYPALEIGSVDGFQGREKEAIILSLVRSNDKGEVGFLKETRRLNVAVTRAKRHVCLICNSETVSHDSELKSLVEYFQEQGEMMSGDLYQ